MSDRKGDWIDTWSGRQFYPMDPRPEEVDIEDISHALSMQCRFTGHCRYFYSVAEHCVRVSYAVRSPENRLWALLHDASEAYLTDLSRPIKYGTELGAIYRQAEDRLMRCIAQRFSLQGDEPSEVKWFDKVLLATEKRDLMKDGGAKWAELPAPLTERIKPMSHYEAEQAFYIRALELGAV